MNNSVDFEEKVIPPKAEGEEENDDPENELEKNTPLIELWFQKYWKTTFEPVKGKTIMVDKKMHDLIKFLLKCGEDSDEKQVTKSLSKEDLLTLMEQINAIMVRIKPGLFSIFTKSYNYQMVLNYLLDLKKRTPSEL